jgi:hypothetical protein
MSLYREARRRRLWLPVAVAGLAVLALVAGVVIGRSTAPERSLRDAVENVQENARTASDALELVTIEYREAVANGEIAAETEYEAAQDGIERAHEAFEGIRDELAVLDPGETRRADEALEELERLVARRASPDDVDRVAAEAARSIRTAARL